MGRAFFSIVIFNPMARLPAYSKELLLNCVFLHIEDDRVYAILSSVGKAF